VLENCAPKAAESLHENARAIDIRILAHTSAEFGAELIEPSER
jgi:hypothetical protein